MIDGWIAGQMDECGWNGQMDGWIIDGLIDGRMDGWMKYTCTWLQEWMNEQKDTLDG